MTHEEILTKAIDKAVANGYKNDYQWRIFIDSLANEDDDHAHPYPLIFNHDFAKALWPSDDNVHHLDVDYVNPNIGGHYDTQEQVSMEHWQLHLMQMVIADDPIAYLGEHL